MNLAGISSTCMKSNGMLLLHQKYPSMDTLLMIENTLLMPRLLPQIIATLYWFESINSRLFYRSSSHIILLLVSDNERLSNDEHLYLCTTDKTASFMSSYCLLLDRLMHRLPCVVSPYMLGRLYSFQLISLCDLPEVQQ